MPAGLIDEQRSVSAWRDLGGDFGQVQVHRLGVAARHDERSAFALLGADGAEDISGGGSLVFGSAGRVPRLAQRRVILFFWPIRALIQLSRDVGEPDLYGVGSDALLAADFFQARGKTFLKSSIAPSA